jgi:site-specific DNA-methyltransferase (cytosine-N4-specific)
VPDEAAVESHVARRAGAVGAGDGVTAIVTRGNAADLHLPDESVDLIVTSPPYFGLRSYQDGGEHYSGQIGDEATPTEYLDALLACTREWMRVLKPGGSIFVNLGDKYAGSPSGPRTPMGDGYTRDYENREFQSRRRVQQAAPPKSLQGLPWRYAIRCIDDLGLILRAEIVWAKPNGLPESVTDRVRRSHEQVFHFVKQPRYFSAVDEVREPQSSAAHHQRYSEAAAGYANKYHGKDGQAGRGGWSKPMGALNPLGKLPGSVWTIPTAPLRVPEELGIDHFAAYPPELVRRIVLGWSPKGGVVLDPFAGTGTTMLVASVHGRVGIGVDLSADYCRLAQWRTTDEKQRAKAAGVKPKPAKKPKPQPVAEVVALEVPGQIDLFSEGEWTA